MRSVLQKWHSRVTDNGKPDLTQQERHLAAAYSNLGRLLEDSSIPAPVRAELAQEFEQIEQIAHKIQQEEIHIAAYGRVGVGKSSLLNTLLGQHRFQTSPLHGETKQEARSQWQLLQQGRVQLIDTPGIDELDGQQREKLAREVSRRADLILFVCEADLTEQEFRALNELARAGRNVILVLNKADRYTRSEQQLLLQRLRQRTADLLPASLVLAAAAEPRDETVIIAEPDGTERETRRPRPVEVSELRSVLWTLLEKEGKALVALNASVFASELDEKVARRIVAARKTVAERIIRNYCMVKGLVVAANPVPIADLIAAAGTDVAMVIHLGEVYGFRLSRREAAKLVLTISAQLAALMGAYWGINLASSAMKTASAGLSTVVTASAQGGLAWYATYLTGQVAQSWFARGKSWGKNGPREVAKAIQDSLDRDSLIRSAKADIARKLKSSAV